MKELGCPFTGVLYAGLMITNEGPLQHEEKENKIKQEKAEDNIKNNDAIKNFMTKFDATIKEKSIKPIN